MAVRALSMNAVLTHVLASDPSYHPPIQVPIDPEDLNKGTKWTDATWDDDATVFSYKPLDVFVMGHIYDRASFMSQTGDGSTDLKMRINETNIDAVRFGLTGMKNFLNHEGNEVSPTFVARSVNGRMYSALSDDILSQIGLAIIAELADKIKAASSINQVVEKNFVSV